jgi:hypothetical protein
MVLDNPILDAKTQKLLGWQPIHPGLVADLDGRALLPRLTLPLTAALLSLYTTAAAPERTPSAEADDSATGADQWHSPGVATRSNAL